MNTLLELFIVFFKLGAFTIGGGIAMLPLLQNTLTEEKKWFTREEFVDIVADNGIVMGAMAGLRAAALGMVAVAMIQLAPSALKNKWAILAALTAFILIAVLKVNTAYVILLFAVLGVTVTLINSRRAVEAAAGEGSASDGNRPGAGEEEGGESE